MSGVVLLKERLELQVPLEVKRQLADLSHRTGVPMSDFILYGYNLVMEQYTQLIGDRLTAITDQAVYESTRDSIALEFAELVAQNFAAQHQSTPASINAQELQARKLEIQKQLRYRPHLDPATLQKHN
jgi:hypothetical protein